MGKLFRICGLLLCFMFGSQFEGLGRAWHLPKQYRGAKTIEDRLEDKLKDLRMELERLNVTHDIPGICRVCKWVIGKVINTIPENDAKEHIKFVLDRACSTYYLLGICRKFVNGYYGKIFIEIIVDHIREPDAICKALHLCRGPTTGKGLLY